MPLDISCFTIDADINASCAPIKIGDYKQVGVMFPYEDLDRTSLSIVDCVADFELLVPSAIRIYDTSFVPFKGSEVTEENKERFKEYMDTVMIPLFNMTPENANIYTRLALGGQRWVVILGIEEGTEAEKNLFQVFGITSGLYVKSKTIDKANQAYLSVTMSQPNSQYPAVFFYDTNKATTEAKIDSWLDYDLIYGGTIANGGAVKLAIDSDKTGYIKLPNGTVLTTVAGAIDTTYTGVGGAITYYVPKDNTIEVLIGNTYGLSGNLIYNGNSTISVGATHVNKIKSLNSNVFSSFNEYLTEIIAENAVDVKSGSCVSLSNVIAPKAEICLVNGCALTAKSIGDILYHAYNNNRLAIQYDFSGGANALQSEVDTYLQNTYNGLTYATVYALLVTTNLGTILIDIA